MTASEGATHPLAGCVRHITDPCCRPVPSAAFAAAARPDRRTEALQYMEVAHTLAAAMSTACAAAGKASDGLLSDAQRHMMAQARAEMQAAAVVA